MIQPNQTFLTYFPATELPITDFRTTRSSCLRAGPFIVIRKIIKDYQLDEILGMFSKQNIAHMDVWADSGFMKKTIKRRLYGSDTKERYFHIYHSIPKEASL